MPAKRKATAADAQLILELYDLRREAVMRQARNFIANFWPQSYEDITKVIAGFGTQENAWLRQVAGYWEMAASLVLRGALDEDLFFDNSGEMYFIFTRFKPYLKQLREEFKAPEMMANIEKVILRTPQGRQRMAAMEKRVEEFARRRAPAAGGSSQ